MRLFAAALLLLALPASAENLAPSPPGKDLVGRLQADVGFLASDNLEGRDTGSRGYAIAADYVAAQFRAIGLEPAGEKGGWFQQVPFRRASFDRPPRLSLTLNGKQFVLEQGKDAALRPSVIAKSPRACPPGSSSSAMVFRIGGYGFDDYRGLNVRGKIVVALSGTPGGLPSDVEAHLNASKDSVAAAAGAIGFIEVPRNNGSAGRGDPVRRGGRPLIDWVDSSGHAGIGSAGPAASAQLFERLGGAVVRRSTKVAGGGPVGSKE